MVVLIFQIIFVIFLVYFIINEALLIKNQGRIYFKQFWNLNEMVMIIFSIVSIAMYIMKNMFTTLAMKEIRETQLGEFVNFNTIALWDDTFTTILAVVSFCATLKFLKLLRFNKRIGMLAATLKHASSDLTSFTFTFAIFMLAYTQYGYLLFGSVLKDYRNFMTSLESVFRLLLGQFAFYDMFAVDAFMGFIFLMSFIFLVFIGLMAIFMTILNDAIETVKEEIANQKNEHEMIDFIFSSVKKITGLDKRFAAKKAEAEKNENKEDDAKSVTSEKQEKFKLSKSDLKRSVSNIGSTISMANVIKHSNKVAATNNKQQKELTVF